MNRTKLVLGALLGALAIHVALIACGSGPGNILDLDGGPFGPSDATAAPPAMLTAPCLPDGPNYSATLQVPGRSADSLLGTQAMVRCKGSCGGSQSGLTYTSLPGSLLIGDNVLVAGCGAVNWYDSAVFIVPPAQ